MARVEERVHIHRPVERVWDVLVDWESQPDWMHDARSVTVTSPQRTGVGVTIDVPTTLVLGIVVTDEMEVTEWVQGRRIAVRHTGRVIRGSGAFELSPTRRPNGAQGTIVTWWEAIDVPLGRMGDAMARSIAVPVVARLFRRSLLTLKRVAEERIPPRLEGW
ncbi:SRPBCC family protein [Pseudomonas sp.]|uniref:SRPBCC family protein n=1 Tax=Pseudomonas sp. TaxID=306 RepID=UPI002C34D6AE|nr:SRPBCC family protein [Pseudomonas sp.]HUE90470.1 SRPBCC family protein [Pseudomonas sp.]